MPVPVVIITNHHPTITNRPRRNRSIKTDTEINITHAVHKCTIDSSGGNRQSVVFGICRALVGTVCPRQFSIESNPVVRRIYSSHLSTVIGHTSQPLAHFAVTPESTYEMLAGDISLVGYELRYLHTSDRKTISTPMSLHPQGIMSGTIEELKTPGIVRSALRTAPVKSVHWVR